MMAMVPLYIMVHSQVAVLLPIGAAHPLCFNLLENTVRTIYTHFESSQTFDFYLTP